MTSSFVNVNEFANFCALLNVQATAQGKRKQNCKLK